MTIFSSPQRAILSINPKEGDTLNIPALTKTEEKVMMFLWKQGKPLSVLEMLESWEGGEKTWKDNYMRAIVRALVEKGALKVAELECRNNRASRRLQPTFSKKDYFAQVVKHGGLSVSEMVEAEAVAMAKKGDKEGMSALLRDLKEIIEEYDTREDDSE